MAIFIVFAAAGCATAPPPARVIHEQPDRLVRLEVTERSSRDQHAHPADIELETLASLLQSLSVEPKKALTASSPFEQASRPRITGEEPFLTDEQVRFLARHVSQGLRRATPLEEVVFAFTAPGETDIREITSGSFYVQNDRLHLLLANYRHPTIGGSEISRATGTPLEVMGRHAYRIIPGPYGRLEPPGGLQSLVTELPDHLVFAYTAPEQPPSSTDRKATPDIEETQATSSSSADKLRELHRLREEGLISDEEFRRLRHTLLESF